VIAAIIGLYVLCVFAALLFVRFVMSWVMTFARDYRPTGAAAGLLEITFTVTDPPLFALRRAIPPLRLGNVALDLSFIVLWVVAYIGIDLLRPYA
jgi:YggT family protein